MKIESLALQSFRNYQKAALQFSEDIVIVVGNNAQGKTNLVESIYTLAFSKSYRARSEKELIAHDKEFAKIGAKIWFQKEQRSKTIDYIISTKGKKIKVNNVEQKTKSQFVGLVNVIKFSPEDLNLVKGSPNVRRKFIDMYLSQLDREYLMTLVKYNRLLKQKNAALKQSQADSSLLQVYNQQLASFIEVLVAKRYAFTEAFFPKVLAAFNKIVEDKEELSIAYVTSFEKDATEADIFTFLQDNIAKESRNFSSLFGIQKDDLIFSIAGQNARNFGSQGQQRTIVLALIIALVDYMQEQIGEYPILILDDVMSELDEKRKVQLLQAFKPDMQIFMTTTSIDDIIDKIDASFELFTVDGGVIEKVQDEKELEQNNK